MCGFTGNELLRGCFWNFAVKFRSIQKYSSSIFFSELVYAVLSFKNLNLCIRRHLLLKARAA